MKCTNCGKENSKSARFCSGCGTQLSVVCPNCGEPVEAESSFCNACGHKLKVKTNPTPKTAPPSGRKHRLWPWLGAGAIVLSLIFVFVITLFYDIEIDLWGDTAAETLSPTETARPEPTQPAFMQAYETESAPTEEAAAAPICQILFESFRDEQNQIFSLGADGEEKQLTASGPNNHEPAWSPDGSQIAFVSDRDGIYQIYLMNADGSNQRRLTDTNANEYMPFWSPDGGQIVFVSDRDFQQHIYTMDTDGSNQRRLTIDDNMNWEPAWSPDGSQIVFSSEREGSFDIFVIGADGENERRLTNSDSRDVNPAWSPDGNQIIFSSNLSGSQEIHVMNKDGSNIRQLTEDASAVTVMPTWSPDGEHILFISNRNDVNEMYLMDADGNNQRQIARSGLEYANPRWLTGCSGMPEEWFADDAQPDGSQADVPQQAPTQGMLPPAASGLEIPTEASELILNLEIDRDRFHCISSNGPTTLTITADVTDQDRGLALFWRLVDKNSGWTLDWENVSMRRSGAQQRVYTFNADAAAGTNNFLYPAGMGETWFQFQIVTGDRTLRTQVYRDEVTFFPCAQ